MRKRLILVANPSAGRRRLGRLTAVLEALRAAGAEPEVRLTSGPGDGTSLAAAAVAGRPDAVVAVGGDGTINEVLNGLVGSEVPLGVLPLGTANVLAAECGLPRSPRRLAAMLVEGPTTTVYPGRCGDHYFLLMAGAGLDAEMVGGVRDELKRRFGKLAYFEAGLRRLLRPLPRLRVEVDGQPGSGCFVLVSKCRCYAGGHVLSPAARLENDRFEVSVFAGGRGRLFGQLLATLAGRPLAGLAARRLSGRRVRIEADGESAYQTDGDWRGHLPVELVATQIPVRLIVPGQAAD